MMRLRWRSTFVATGILITANAVRVLTDPFGQVSTAGAMFVKGSSEALAILDRVRDAGRLNSVRTLLLEGTLTIPAGLLPADTGPVVYRFLLPDSIQETTQYRSQPYVFTLAGRDFWQLPTVADVETSRYNKLRALADWSLLVLVRAPAQFPVVAAISDDTRKGTVTLTFSADNYLRRASYDRKTWRPVMIEHDYKNNQGGTERSRLTVSAFSAVEGCQLPRVILRSLHDGDEPHKIDFTKIAVNKDVSIRDFQRR